MENLLFVFKGNECRRAHKKYGGDCNSYTRIGVAVIRSITVSLLKTRICLSAMI